MTSSNESHVRLPAKEPVRGKDKHSHPNDHEDHQANRIVPALVVGRKEGADGGLRPPGKRAMKRTCQDSGTLMKAQHYTTTILECCGTKRVPQTQNSRKLCSRNADCVIQKIQNLKILVN